jgi:hypothetical protein
MLMERDLKDILDGIYVMARIPHRIYENEF